MDKNSFYDPVTKKYYVVSCGIPEDKKDAIVSGIKSIKGVVFSNFVYNKTLYSYFWFSEINIPYDRLVKQIGNIHKNLCKKGENNVISQKRKEKAIIPIQEKKEAKEPIPIIRGNRKVSSFIKTKEKKKDKKKKSSIIPYAPVYRNRTSNIVKRNIYLNNHNRTENILNVILMIVVSILYTGCLALSYFFRVGR